MDTRSKKQSNVHDLDTLGFMSYRILEQEKTGIGRSTSNDLVLEHDYTVSRKHAELLRAGNRIILRDIGSGNGTRVNGVQIDSEIELKSGDIIIFGYSCFVFSCAPQPALWRVQFVPEVSAELSTHDQIGIHAGKDSDSVVTTPLG